ncbi:Dabb family protein [Luteolibacter pohnpeiensis]|uniref:Dabb family protein n=1 Tax=Luteolibacter pohnpeiensis TaxID=454153 RepID=A0A934S6M9_9BACT|nr:Dabb family protein [Luteolibacter pohnpeiensis]MBK1884065.1 Dabb family protein [Luteolibacter pohnpeiensis]
MIHHIVLCELKLNTTPETLESLVRNSRSLLLKIPEVLNVRSGRNVSPSSDWSFFYSIEVESLEKLSIVLDDPYYLKLHQKFIRPHVATQASESYELDPTKPLKYS